MNTYYFTYEHIFKYGMLFYNVLKDKKNWKELTEKKHVTLSDKNSLSFFKSYIDGEYVFCLKHNLAKLLNDLPYIPKTYVMENDGRIKNNFEYVNEYKMRKIWFVKPSSNVIGAGDGIYLVNSINDIHITKKIQKKDEEVDIKYWIIQENIEKPLLIDNKKFAIRYYVVCLYDKIKLYVYRSKIFKINICSMEYEENSLNKKVHISHTASETSDINDIKLWYNNKLQTPTGKKIEYNFDMMKLKTNMEMISKDVFNKVSVKLNSDNNMGYAIYGLDFVFDENLNPYLLEINQSPFLSFPDEVLKILTYKMLDGIIELLLILRKNGNMPNKISILKLINNCFIKNKN